MENFNEDIKKITDDTPIEGVLTIGNVLEELHLMVGIILHDIKDLAESGKIGVVLGVDASGRLPALLLWSVIKKIHPVEIRFIAGRRDIRKNFFNFLSSNLNKKKKLLGQKHKLKQWLTSEIFEELQNTDKEVLIVDDTISTGESIDEICRILRQAGIKYKVAALSFQHFHYPDVVARRLGILADDMFIADYGPILGYSHACMYGVKKTPGDTHATTLSEVDRQIYNKMIRYVRGRIKEISNQLAGEIGWL